MSGMVRQICNLYVLGQSNKYMRRRHLISQNLAHPISILKPNSPHQPIPNRDNNTIRNDTRRNTSGNKMPDLQVPLARLGIFHHDGGHIGKARSGQAHGGGSHENTSHDEQIGMRLGHAGAHLLDQRQDDQCCHGVGDESRHDANQTGKDAHDCVEGEVFDAVGDGCSNGVEEARRVDGFSESKTASGQDDDGPEEVIEVFFGKNASAKEENDRDDGDNTHVTENALQLMANTPKHDCQKSDESDEVLNSGEAVFHGPNRNDGGVAARTECEQEKNPDQDDGNDADGKGDEEPNAPSWRGVHVLESDQVLRRGDWRSSSANIAGKSNTQKEGLCHVGVGGQVAKDGL